jgi:hypothetical protein
LRGPAEPWAGSLTQNRTKNNAQHVKKPQVRIYANHKSTGYFDDEIGVANEYAFDFALLDFNK